MMDFTLISWATCCIICIFTVIWLIKKKLLFNTIGNNANEKDLLKIHHLKSLRDIKNLLLLDDGDLIRDSLHGKVLPESGTSQAKISYLSDYLQGITTDRRGLLEKALKSSTASMIRDIKSTPEEPREFSEVLLSCILDLSCRVAFGADYKLDKLQEQKLKDIIQLWSALDITSISNKHEDSDIDKFLEERENLHTILKDIISNIKDKNDDDLEDNQLCFVKYCLQKQINDNEPTYLLRDLTSFFLCCGDALYKTLISALAFMADSPDVLESMQNELESTGDKEPVLLWLQNRGKVPFADSVLREVYRLASCAPAINTIRNIKSLGNNKKELFVVHLNEILLDTKAWKNVENFKPERFLDEDGKVIQHEYFVPFGLGKCCCPGKDFATLSSFIILSTVLLHVKKQSSTENKESSI